MSPIGAAVSAPLAAAGAPDDRDKDRRRSPDRRDDRRRDDYRRDYGMCVCMYVMCVCAYRECMHARMCVCVCWNVCMQAAVALSTPITMTLVVA